MPKLPRLRAVLEIILLKCERNHGMLMWINVPGVEIVQLPVG